MAGRGDDDGLPINVFREVHKGLRFATSAILNNAARATAHPASLDALARAWADVSQLLTMHHRHGASIVEPILAVHAPELVARLADDDVVLVSATRRLDRAATAIVRAPADHQWSLLEEFYLGVADLAATVFGHLRFREVEVMGSLRLAMSDDDLERLRVRLRDDVTPTEMETLLRAMMPVLNLAERIDVLDDLQRSTDDERFEAYRSAVETALGSREYHDLAHALRLG